MIGNILDNTTELYMIKYTFGEVFSSGRATLYTNPSDQTVISGQFTSFPLSRLCKGQKCVYCSRLLNYVLWGKNKVIEKILYVVDINFESAGKKMKIWEDTVDELIHKDNQSTYLPFIRIAKLFDTLNRRT